MTLSLKEIAYNLLPELAAEIHLPENPSVDEQTIAFQDAVISRANEILDRRKNNVFADHLNIATRGEVERAITAYTLQYLLNLSLSLEATADLAQQLITIAKRHKVQIPLDWIKMSKYQDLNIDESEVNFVERRRPVL